MLKNETWFVTTKDNESFYATIKNTSPDSITFKLYAGSIATFLKTELESLKPTIYA